MSAPGATLTPSLPPRRRRLRLGRAEPLVWIAPAIAVVAFVFGYSMVELVRQALAHHGHWVGLRNIRLVLTDPTFQTALEHNARLLLAVPVLVLLALLLSVLLFEAFRGWRFHRATVFLPYVLPIPVVAVIFGQMLQLDGLLNRGLRGAGLGSLAYDWLGQPGWALWTMTGVIIWKELGFGVIIFLARLFALPTDVYEAARADGAGWWRTHWHVSLPGLRPIILFYLVIEGITLLSWVFNYVFVMTGGGPGDATGVLETYIYSNLITYRLTWLAASAATVVLGSVAILAAIALITRRVLAWRGA